MDQLLEFASNHMILVSALVVVSALLIHNLVAGGGGKKMSSADKAASSPARVMTRPPFSKRQLPPICSASTSCSVGSPSTQETADRSNSKLICAWASAVKEPEIGPQLGLESAEVVIEAVFEDLDLKKKILADVTRRPGNIHQ